MSAPLLKRLLEKFCAHQFSWPHTGANGQDYQVCLVCGAAYEFDCATMRRTGRLATPAATQHEFLSGKETGTRR